MTTALDLAPPTDAVPPAERPTPDEMIEIIRQETAAMPSLVAMVYTLHRVFDFMPDEVRARIRRDADTFSRAVKAPALPPSAPVDWIGRYLGHPKWRPPRGQWYVPIRHSAPPFTIPDHP